MAIAEGYILSERRNFRASRNMVHETHLDPSMYHESGRDGGIEKRG